MLNNMVENENTHFANILIPFLKSCPPHDIRKDIEILAKLVFIFHHVIQRNEASGYTLNLLSTNKICQLTRFKS